MFNGFLLLKRSGGLPRRAGFARGCLFYLLFSLLFVSPCIIIRVTVLGLPFLERRVLSFFSDFCGSQRRSPELSTGNRTTHICLVVCVGFVAVSFLQSSSVCVWEETVFVFHVFVWIFSECLELGGNGYVLVLCFLCARDNIYVCDCVRDGAPERKGELDRTDRGES